MHKDAILRSLARRAREVRRRDLVMLHRAGLGHPGGDLSAIDILVTLYWGHSQGRPWNPRWPERDRFILSKGHSAGALYATLATAGFFPLDELATFAQPASRLSGHPNRTKVAGRGDQHRRPGPRPARRRGLRAGCPPDGAAWRTFVLTGDGELQEGSNWEAAMAAAH